MSPPALLAALLTAVAVAAAAGLAVPPTRGLAARVGPYAQLARSRLGRSADFSVMAGAQRHSGPAVGAVFGPLAVALARRLSNAVDAGGEAELSRRLRHGGFADISPEQYRMRQLGWALSGATVYGALGFAASAGAAPALVAVAAGGVTGLTQWRGRVNRAIKARRARMRIELYTVAQLLAMTMRTGHGPVEAINRVIRQGQGPVVDELAEALRWIGGGMDEVAALELLATETPEPTAARLYRLMAAGIASGGDLARSLLVVSEDIRNERREDLERTATARRGTMLVPTVLVMAPVVLLFLIAPLPLVIFGAR